jgi:predicted phage tail protein
MQEEKQIVIAGAGGGGKGGGSGGRQAVEAEDSLQSRAMISLLDLIGEGVIGGLVAGAESIYLDDTPLGNSDGSFNFTGVSWDSRIGEQDQAVIPGYSDVETPYNVSVQVKKLTPHVITINGAQTDAVRVVVSLPSLRSQDKTTGDINGTSVSYKFSISVNGGSYTDVLVDGDATLTISGKTNSKYQRSHLIYLPKPAGATTWNIMMTRLTDDAPDASLSNETWFDSYTEIIDSQLSYPNSALVGIRIDSSQFNHIPQRSYLVNGLYIKVPSNYDPVTRTYAGVWNGGLKVALSNNPAWVLYDLLTSTRYGLGNHISPSQVDKAKLYQIGRYCDEMVSDGFGGTEPRFVINTVIQTQAEAYKLISDLSSAFRGMTFWNGAMVGFTQDSPSSAGMVFTPANVVDGLFNYTGSARRDRHSIVNVTWNDPLDKYKQKIEYVEDAESVAKFGVRKTDIVAFGCTSRGQANRVGRWLLYSERLESDIVTFKVGLDAATVLPGEIIRILDTYRAGKRMGGRIVATTATSITLDAPITLANGSAMLSMRLPDGSFVDRVVLQAPGEYSVLTWTEPLTTQPLNNSMWMVSEASLEPMLARVIGIAQDGSKLDQFTITAIEHNPSKFDAIEKNLQLEETKTSVIDTNATTVPTNVKVVEAPYEVAPGLIGTRLTLSWYAPMPLFEIRWRRTGKYASSWQTITTSSMSIDLDNVRKSSHEFEVRSLNNFGRKSDLVAIQYTPVGKTTAPGDVLNFVVTRRTTDLMLTWDAVKDIDVSGYEVRWGNSWDDSTLITTNFKGTMLIHDQSTAGVFFYYIRSIDSAGQYSDNVTTYRLVLDPPAPVSQFDCIQSGNRLEFRWRPNAELNIVSYEIREGSEWATSQLITQTLSTTYTMPSGTTGTRTFWIKAIASPGIYADEASFVVSGVIKPQNSNIVYDVDKHLEGFPGVTHGVFYYDDALQMEPNYARSEYLFDVHLPYRLRAQNTIFSDLAAVTEATLNWANALFAWDSADGSKPWAPTGNATAISAQFQIATDIGLYANDVDGWRLNGGLTSVGGTPPSQSHGVTYGEGRYGQGVFVQDTTQVAWPVSIPSSFSKTFWIQPKQLTDAVFITLSGSSGSLKVGYSVREAAFYLEDGNGHRNVVPHLLTVDERICIGISQSSLDRALYVGSMDGSQINSDVEPYTAVGAFTSLALY